jgi:hypothetical protein
MGIEVKDFYSFKNRGLFFERFTYKWSILFTVRHPP